MPSRTARLLLGVTAAALAVTIFAFALGDRLTILENASPTVPAASASSAPRPALVDVELPAEFAPRESLVSPDGRYVAAAARDRGSVRLYRLGALMPGTVNLQLQRIAEVRGYVQYGDVSWLEDSSAVLVRSDLVPGHTLEDRATHPAFRVVMLNTDGTVATAPANVTSSPLTSYPQRRTPLSPDGLWLPVGDDCCTFRVRLLSRSGLDVRTVVAAPTDGSTVAFFGWDGDGYLLYQQSSPGLSAIVALNADGSVRYRVSAPAEFHGALGRPIAVAKDRSWRLVQFGFGIGSDFREYRLLVGSELRPLSPEIQESMRFGGAFASGSEPARGIRGFRPILARLRPWCPS